MKLRWELAALNRRRNCARLATAVVAAGLLAVSSGDVAIAADVGQNASDESSHSNGGSAWPPTNVYWPPTQGVDNTSDAADDGRESPSVSPTVIILPDGQPVPPDDGPDEH